jgi:fumarate reductase subunit D
MEAHSKRSNDAFWWALFGAGGIMAAMFIPVLVLIVGLAIPLGWVATPGYEELLEMARHPLSRLLLFVVISLSMFHGAHRFRFTLYDGLQLKHLEKIIIVLCYGSAILVTLLAAVLLLQI